MHHPLIGPFWGNIAIILLAGGVSLGCFVAMCRMLGRPGEHDPRHPKYLILEERCAGLEEASRTGG